MIEPLFNDIIVDDNTKQFIDGIQNKPRVESFGVQSPVDDVPPEFQEAIRQDEAAEAMAQAVAGVPEGISGEPAPAIEKPVLDYDEQADLLVGVADSVQQIAFSAIGKRKMFSAEERTKIKEILKKKRKKQELTEEEQELLEAWHEFKDFEETLPFEDKEAEMIRKPLAKVLEMQAANFDPRTALLLAVGMVTAPRVLALKELERE